MLLSAPHGASAQSFRGATIVAKEEEPGAPPMQEGVWYGPEALMPWELEFHDKKASRVWVWSGVWDVSYWMPWLTPKWMVGLIAGGRGVRRRGGRPRRPGHHVAGLPGTEGSMFGVYTYI